MRQTTRTLPSANETKWTVISGPMKGSVRLMTAAEFTIGRSAECEFLIVNDTKCSRQHASVQWNGTDCEILSLAETNPVMVNGREVMRTVLANGDTVTLGKTEVQFNLITRSPQTTRVHTAITVVHSPPTQITTNAFEPQPHYASPPPRARAAPSNPGKIIFYFVLALTLLWLFTGNSAKKKAQQALRTEQQIQADIDAANKLNEVAQNLPSKRFAKTVGTQQAQENFVRGFRDYRKGQFERSLDSFQACVTLDPEHALCNRYLRLAQRRFHELVQYNIVLGRKYRDQNQFQACKAAFLNVMVMIKDVNNPAFREARANYDACKTLMEGHF